MVFVVLIAHMGSTSLGSTSFQCICRQLTLKQAHDNADSVVTGKILQVMPYARLCDGVPCFDPPPVTGNLLVKVHLLSTLKGCRPPMPLWIVTESQPSGCGVPFEEGQRWLLNLPRPRFTRQVGEPTRFYELDRCGRHTQLRFLSRKQKRELTECSMLPENQCVRGHRISP